MVRVDSFLLLDCILRIAAWNFIEWWKKGMFIFSTFFSFLSTVIPLEAYKLFFLLNFQSKISRDCHSSSSDQQDIPVPLNQNSFPSWVMTTVVIKSSLSFIFLFAFLSAYLFANITLPFICLYSSSSSCFYFYLLWENENESRVTMMSLMSLSCPWNQSKK